MKEIPERRANRGVKPKSLKRDEVVIPKHYHPNPLRNNLGPLPRVKCISELPEGTKYFPLYPVFKFVDNFLNNTPRSPCQCGTPKGAPRKCPPVAPIVKSTKKCMCVNKTNLISCIKPEKPMRQLVSKKANVCTPRRPYMEKRDRIGPAVCNAPNNVRFSFDGCTNKDPPRYVNIENRPNIYYVEQLKNEIKQSTYQCCSPKAKNDCVSKIKDELLCARSKCIDDARDLINELQNEILNYRLQTKTKYSSSCSNICSGDRFGGSSAQLYNSKNTLETKQIGESPGSPRDVAIRFRPCETLWESKFSYPSSTDTVLTVQTVTFEEKLQEANTLLEKVRVTLKDLEHGVQKQGECKKMECNKSGHCVNMVCSFHGQCQTYINAPDKTQKTPEDTVIESPRNAPKTQETTPAESPKSTPKSAENKVGDTLKSPTKRTKSGKKSPGSPKIEHRDHREKTPTGKKSSSGKLNTISEVSESNVIHSQEEDSTEEFMIPVPRMETSSSRYNDVFQELDSSKISTQNRATSPFVERSQSPFRIRRESSPYSISATSVDEVADLAQNKTQQKAARSRSRSLSIQMMPSVSIRSGLVIQQTLRLSIKPTGSVTNDMTSNSNIGYEEVTAAKEVFDESSSSSTRSSRIERYIPEKPHIKPRVTEEADVESSSTSTKSSKIERYIPEKPNIKPRVTEEVDDDTLLLYRSFQIVENPSDYHSASRAARYSVSTLPKGLARHFNESVSTGAACANVKDCTTCTRLLECKGTRNPWDLGFYKSVAVQCPSQIELPLQLSTHFSINGDVADVDSDQASEHEDSILSPSAVNKALNIDPVARSLSLTSSSYDESEQPVRDSADLSNQIPLFPPPNLKKSQEEELLSVQAAAAAEEEEEKEENQPEPLKKLECSSSDFSFAKDKSAIAQTVRNPDIISTFSSTSSSSYTVRSSLDQSKEYHKNETPPKIEPKKPSEMSVKISPVPPDKKDKKIDDKKIDDKKIDDKKIDECEQVSFPSSDTEVVSERGSGHNPMDDFIKGLTGTSEDHINKLRSTPSFPHHDIKTWSRTQIKALSEEEEISELEHNDKEGEALQLQASYEEVMQHSVDYTNPKDAGKFNVQKNDEISKDTKDQIVMSVFEDRGGEGDEMMRHHLRKRLPFYKRMFSSKKMDVMQKSSSHPSPIDESISEGEVNCKSTYSVGEIRPYKYHDVLKKFESDRFKTRRHHDEKISIKGASSNVGKQRMEYNHWVAHYLMNSQNLPALNDSSSSGENFKKN